MRPRRLGNSSEVTIHTGRRAWPASAGERDTLNGSCSRPRSSSTTRPDDCYNVDAWESEEAFNSFGEMRLSPGMAKAGVNVQREVNFEPAYEGFTPNR